MAAATKRATDPEGWKQWIQTESEKIGGIFEGLNEAKDETKNAMAAGWKAITDGTLYEILSHPEAHALPAIEAMSHAIDTASKDPSLAVKAVEQIGNSILKASNDYTNMSNHDKGVVIGKTMFFMVNPEGSTEGAEVALKVADRVATKIDKVVMDTIEHSVKVAQSSAKNLPETALETKQILLAYLQSKGLNSAEMELAGVPKGFFDGVRPADETAHILKMETKNVGSDITGASSQKLLSQADNLSAVLKKAIPDAEEKLATLSTLQDFPERQQILQRLAQLSEQSKIDLDFALTKCDLKHLQDYEKSAHNLNFLKENPIKDLSAKDNLLLQRELQKHMDNLADAVKRNAPEKEIASFNKRLKGATDYIDEFKVQEAIIFEAGIHKVSLTEVARQFTYNEAQKELFSGLRQLALDLKEAGCETLYLDGSFITGKKIPADFDACWEPFKGKGVAKFLGETEAELAERKTKYFGDIFPRFSDEYGDRVKHWQLNTRTGQTKGIIKIDLRELQ